ncbi:MAG TPA: hypothetical protein VNU68_11780 [Verrucomicrobiae bacterium]|nr:hypothetical protein [Verrucomicrobiae bacterium]
MCSTSAAGLFLAAVCWAVAVGSAAAAPRPAAAEGDDQTPTKYQGIGLCQFVLKDYTLSPQIEKSINQVVQRLLDQHRTTFKFYPRPDFRLHMRIFGKFEDYAQFTTNHGVSVPGLSRAGLTNLAGYYSRNTKELVTWRQQLGTTFGNVLLHEASHAIMDAHFRRSPQWLLEGCAEYFAYPPDMQDARDKFSLRTRWGLLNIWLRDGKLASLSSFVNLKQADWDKMDIDRAYITSWSIFQYLASSEANRMVVRKLLTPRGFQGEMSSEGPPRAETDGATLLEKEYPGGLKKLEMDWHRWIVQTGRQLFPERSLDRLRELDQERERRQGGP